MGHYRRISVNGTDYRWAAGKTTTKVQRMSGPKTLETVFYDHDKWATPHRSASYHDVADGKQQVPTYLHGFIVKPADVRGMILGERHWKDYPCKAHPNMTVTGLCGSPFSAEIEDKTILVSNCPECLYESWLAT